MANCKPLELIGKNGENGIVNTKGWQVRANAKKVDGNGKALQGATFEVFSSADMNKESYIGLLTSGVDGMTDNFDSWIL